MSVVDDDVNFVKNNTFIVHGEVNTVTMVIVRLI